MSAFPPSAPFPPFDPDEEALRRRRGRLVVELLAACGVEDWGSVNHTDLLIPGLDGPPERVVHIGPAPFIEIQRYLRDEQGQFYVDPDDPKRVADEVLVVPCQWPLRSPPASVAGEGRAD